jgi:hypothetical protein
MVRHNQTVEHDPLADLHRRLPQFITKSFHPKTAGFTATINALKEALPPNVGTTTWSKREVVAEDTDCSTPNFTFNGDLPDDLAVPEVSYPPNVAVSGMVPCTNQLEKFLGTLGETHVVALDQSPNLVLMYDGMAEILGAADDDSALSSWEQLYSNLRSKVSFSTIILAATVLPPLELTQYMQERFVRVNERIVAKGWEMKSAQPGQRVLPVDLAQIVAGPM